MQGGSIMQCKAVLGLLALIVTLVLSATAAQAGAGGSPTTLTGFLVCHAIKGEDPGGEFDVESSFGVDSNLNPILQRVKIGKAALACAFARLFPPPTSETPAPDPIDPGTAEQMTCYPLSNSNKAEVKPTPEWGFSGDALVGDPVDVPVPPTALQYLCAPGAYSFPQ
jgi:hypothetical protein